LRLHIKLKFFDIAWGTLNAAGRLCRVSEIISLCAMSLPARSGFMAFAEIAATILFLSREPLAKSPAAASALVARLISLDLRGKKSLLHR